MKSINIIATTISGSIRDWGKMSSIENEFKKHYSGAVHVHIVDNHMDAKRKAHALVQEGERLLVSAGGAGTFNSVLEGSRSNTGYPEDLRLAFLRKGSADLIGKVLKIPDNLERAAEVIVRSIQEDRTLESDVLQITINDRKHHIIGFGGIGIFGIVPYFTESKFKKYYKGILGQFLGDRGPFLVGVNLAIIRYYTDCIFSKYTFKVEAKEYSFLPTRYASVIVVNGDLGKDFPVASGMDLGSGDFKVILMRDLGILNAYRQLMDTWRGKLEKSSRKNEISVFRTTTLKISPSKPTKYMINVDGLLEITDRGISFEISDRIKLITC